VPLDNSGFLDAGSWQGRGGKPKEEDITLDTGRSGRLVLITEKKKKKVGRKETFGLTGIPINGSEKVLLKGFGRGKTEQEKDEPP